MSTMAITWVKLGDGVQNNLATPEFFIRETIEREAVTTSGTSAPSAVCPAGANAAIISAVDAALIVTSGPATPVASPTQGVDCAVGEKAYLFAEPGVTMIAGIER